MSGTALTDNQSKVYNFLVKRTAGGIPPTVREICAATGIKSTSTVHAVLNALEQNGYISRDARYSRAIKIEGAANAAQVPVIGRVAAGQPILAVEEIEDYIPYPAVDPEGLFGLRVQGYSMKNIGIMPDDIVIADRNAYVKVGDIVIGMDGDEATVKRYLKEPDGTVVFMPENEDFEPIYPENPSILGKVIGCYRRY